MKPQHAAGLVLCCWNGTNDRIHSFHDTEGTALDATRNNWRLYIQWVPANKYSIGDTIETADLLNPDFQM